MDKVTPEWLKEQIKIHHNGDRYEFSEAVHISRSLVEKIFSYRGIADYHKDHFYKHFLALENNLI